MPVSDSERAWAAVLRLHARLVPVFHGEVQSAGLSLVWYDVLLELNSAGGRLRMSELGERVVLSRTRVSRIVDELVPAGLVEREPNPDDARSSFAVLTDEGRRRFRAAAKVYQVAIERELRSRLSDTDIQDLARIVSKATAPDHPPH